MSPSRLPMNPIVKLADLIQLKLTSKACVYWFNQYYCYRELKIETFIGTKPQNSMGNYKRINQKGLAFHAEAKQKNH